jgi:hypothetical protein
MSMEQKRWTLRDVGLMEETASRTRVAIADREREITRLERGLAEVQLDEARRAEVKKLTAELKEAETDRDDLTRGLRVLNPLIKERRLLAYGTLIREWYDDKLAPAAAKAHERRAHHLGKIKQLEAQLRTSRAKAEQHRERGKLLADASTALRCALNLDGVAPIEAPEGKRGPGAASRLTELERALNRRDYAAAARSAVRALADDPAGIPELGEAVEGLLLAHSPRSGQQLMAERRDAKDAAERAELAKVDEWLREQLADGPVPYDTLRDRAKAAGITVRGRSKRGWGQATLAEAGRRIGAFPVVAYRGSDPEQLVAARQYEDGVLYWTLRKTKGLMVPSEFVRSTAQAAAIR